MAPPTSLLDRRGSAVADTYVTNAFGGDDSVLDLTALRHDVPSAGEPSAAAPVRAKSAPAKRMTATKKPVKRAAKKA